MFSNYFYLSRAVFELNKILCGSIIKDIYSQEKNILFFHIPTGTLPDRHLIISANPQKPYLLIRDHKKAKKNAVGFFENYLPAEILNLQIANNDRIIKISLDTSEQYFVVKGRNTNIYLVDKQNTELLFKKSNESILTSIQNKPFTTGSEFNFISREKTSTSIKELKNQFPMISAEIKNEIMFRKSLNTDYDFLELFKIIVNEIFHQNIGIGYNYDLGKFIFAPENFASVETSKKYKLFDNYNTALKFFLTSSFKESRKKNIKAELEKYFDKELSKLSSKLNKLKLRIDNGPQDELYYKIANLLLVNKDNIKKGMASIDLEEYQTSENIKIKLNPKLSPQDNIDKYFEKARDEKVNFKKSKELFKFNEEIFDKTKKKYLLFKESDSEDEVLRIYESIRPKQEKRIKMDDGLKFKYWHYILDGKYNIYIGRDSKSNDYLSVKFAKQNDYWFHARGMPGSHVVLKVDSKKEVIPKNIIKQAASLAAYYSKAKTAGTVPVSYTFAKFVYKKKGLEPGKVILTKENTILVKPDIPAGAELFSE